MGSKALKLHREVLKNQGRDVRWLAKEFRARGVGGESRAPGVCEIPVGTAGPNEIFEAAVVKDDVPMLVPVILLRKMRGVFYLSKMVLTARGQHAHLEPERIGLVSVDATAKD